MGEGIDEYLRLDSISRLEIDMRRAVLTILMAGMLAGTGLLDAQGLRFGVGGGVVVPTGDYSKADRLGWLIGGDATHWFPGMHLGLRVEGSYSRTSHKSGVSGQSRIAGGMVEVVYGFWVTSNRLRAYVLGGLGDYNIKVDVGDTISTSRWQGGFGGGAGLACRVGTGTTRLFLEARYIDIHTQALPQTFLPIRIGVRFGR